jgi:oligopeptide/dipeptide ABC transporter ATP-binding protein
MTQRINVMYAGRIVEKADTGELFGNPKMPYTWGLLRSIPRLDESRKAKLVPIEGLPPDLIAPPPGCKFEPRCQYRRDVCHEKEPPLQHIPNSKPDHEARCWGTQAGGWLVDTDWRREIGDTRLLEAIKQETASVTTTTDTPGECRDGCDDAHHAAEGRVHPAEPLHRDRRERAQPARGRRAQDALPADAGDHLPAPGRRGARRGRDRLLRREG